MSSAADPEPVELVCDLLVCGGGLGGVAAALRAARLGRRVCLIEETGWLGGQISSQGVSHLDEHQYIEVFGGTAAYYDLRDAIRDYYRSHYALTREAARTPNLNPGSAWVSRLSFEPRVGAAVLDGMLTGPHDSGSLQLFFHTRAVGAEVYGGRIATVLTRDTQSGAPLRFRPAFVLDATDHGDLFVLTATAYALGAEARGETGEPSAPERGDPGCVQSFTFPFAVEFRPGEVHTIAKPEDYDANRQAQPYSLAATPWLPGAPVYRMFATAPNTYGPFFTYRRILDARNFDDPRVPHDVATINWPSNDFRSGTLVDRHADDQARILEQARRLSLGFLYWLQTEAPRDDGGVGYPELRPRPDVMGSAEGLSQAPYVREGRRLRARVTIREQDIARALHPGPRAAAFDDTVGIGFYPIDLHGCGRETLSVATRPFQIPLGALVPARTVNLLPAAKNIGTTHITNGAYRLHPVEWAVGEAAAVVAVFCQRVGAAPHEVLDRHELVRRLQVVLLDQGIPLYWYDDVPLEHQAFVATQLLAVEGVWDGNDETLHFSPEAGMTLGQGKQRVAALARGIQRWRGPASADPDAEVLRPGPEDTVLPLRWDAAVTLVTLAVPGAVPPPHAAGTTITRGDLAVWLGALLREAIERDGLLRQAKSLR
ncbi:MAG TPA: FAD-dependent oxidoreductase [bacterium]|nr:FAD-dependent oxidoreductase [bacterium]